MAGGVSVRSSDGSGRVTCTRRPEMLPREDEVGSSDTGTP